MCFTKATETKKGVTWMSVGRIVKKSKDGQTKEGDDEVEGTGISGWISRGKGS